MINTILTISSIIGAITTIITAVIVIYKFARNIETKFEKIAKNQEETQLSVLRLTVINESMPLDERIDAGEKYVALGGNGSVHALYDVLKEQYEEELRKKR